MGFSLTYCFVSSHLSKLHTFPAYKSQKNALASSCILAMSIACLLSVELVRSRRRRREWSVHIRYAITTQDKARRAVAISVAFIVRMAGHCSLVGVLVWLVLLSVPWGRAEV